MKAEHIHEALDLLPEDLIEKVDRLRSGKAHSPNRLYKNLGAIAACLALLILGSFAIGTLSGGWGGSAESADMSMSLNSAAPEIFGETDAATSTGAAVTQESEKFGWDSTDATASKESVRPGETGALIAAARFVYTDPVQPAIDHAPVVVIRSLQELEQLRAAADLSSVLKTSERYDEAYFSENVLILADLGQGSSSISHSITGIVSTGDQVWELQVRQTVPEVATCDMVQWNMLLEVEKDLIQPGDSITLSLINEEE